MGSNKIKVDTSLHLNDMLGRPLETKRVLRHPQTLEVIEERAADYLLQHVLVGVLNGARFSDALPGKEKLAIWSINKKLMGEPGVIELTDTESALARKASEQLQPYLMGQVHEALDGPSITVSKE